MKLQGTRVFKLQINEFNSFYSMAMISKKEKCVYLFLKKLTKPYESDIHTQIYISKNLARILNQICTFIYF